MATIEQLIANVEKIRHFVGVYLDVPAPNQKQRDALKVDLVRLDKNLAALREALLQPVAAVEPAVVRAAAAIPEYDHVLTELEEFVVLVREQDKLLIAQGKPAGHDGALRGATTLAEIIDICERFNLPILLAKYRDLVVPGTAQ